MKLSLWLLALPLLHAQDTRKVVEPQFPPACEVLTARMAAPGGTLSDADERRPDRYITAQGKSSAAQDSGFVFQRCKLTAAPGVGNVWLGCPWRPYASVVFLHTQMGAHIEAAGWREWHPGETHYMDTVSYAGFENSGPGAHATERDAHTKMLTPADAAAFEARRFLAGADGWDPTARRQ